MVRTRSQGLSPSVRSLPASRRRGTSNRSLLNRGFLGGRARKGYSETYKHTRKNASFLKKKFGRPLTTSSFTLPADQSAHVRRAGSTSSRGSVSTIASSHGSSYRGQTNARRRRLSSTTEVKRPISPVYAKVDKNRPRKTLAETASVKKKPGIYGKFKAHFLRPKREPKSTFKKGVLQPYLEHKSVTRNRKARAKAPLPPDFHEYIDKVDGKFHPTTISQKLRGPVGHARKHSYASSGKSSLSGFRPNSEASSVRSHSSLNSLRSDRSLSRPSSVNSSFSSVKTPRSSLSRHSSLSSTDLGSWNWSKWSKRSEHLKNLEGSRSSKFSRASTLKPVNKPVKFTGKKYKPGNETLDWRRLHRIEPSYHNNSSRRLSQTSLRSERGIDTGLEGGPASLGHQERGVDIGEAHPKTRPTRPKVISTPVKKPVISKPKSDKFLKGIKSSDLAAHSEPSKSMTTAKPLKTFQPEAAPRKINAFRERGVDIGSAHPKTRPRPPAAAATVPTGEKRRKRFLPATPKKRLLPATPTTTSESTKVKKFSETRHPKTSTPAKDLTRHASLGSVSSESLLPRTPSAVSEESRRTRAFTQRQPSVHSFASSAGKSSSRSSAASSLGSAVHPKSFTEFQSLASGRSVHTATPRSSLRSSTGAKHHETEAKRALTPTPSVVSRRSSGGAGGHSFASRFNSLPPSYHSRSNSLPPSYHTNAPQLSRRTSLPLSEHSSVPSSASALAQRGRRRHYAEPAPLKRQRTLHPATTVKKEPLSRQSSLHLGGGDIDTRPTTTPLPKRRRISGIRNPYIGRPEELGHPAERAATGTAEKVGKKKGRNIGKHVRTGLLGASVGLSAASLATKGNTSKATVNVYKQPTSSTPVYNPPPQNNQPTTSTSSVSNTGVVSGARAPMRPGAR